jgi:hypothetical protein
VSAGCTAPGAVRDAASDHGPPGALVRRAVADEPAHTVHHIVDMMKTVKHTFTSIGDHSGDLARTIGSGTADLARRFGGGTAGLAKRIGPRRGLLGLAVLAAAIGGSVVLVRYLRARTAERVDADGSGETNRGNRMSKARARAQHAADAHVSH